MNTSDPALRRLPTAQTLVGDGAIRMAPLLGLPQLLAELGVDPDQTIREGGGDLAAFDDADKTIPFPALGRLLAHCARVTAYPHLGLELGQRLGLDVLGLIGAMARVAPDLGTALRLIILHLHLHDRGAVPLLWERGDQARLGYVIHWPDVPGIEQIYDGALAISYNLIRALAGPSWRASAVWLCRPSPEQPAPYQAHFRARLHFAASFVAVGQLTLPFTSRQRG
ncbi:Virulence-regulating protein VirS [Thiorhodovibrio winogradskyi]|uniref:Virulence-regulating protein VirS n=1 Tax=Thiorhodovibrio winogradskyi TaxID=77007 RepID=A0ABZ0SGP5_9GAMM|nr:AraC family transcriptional regulator ligand-binding domain-containing protein [Thiorhodovibrio winogradskyi]